jgi:hypothetical protein
MFKSKASAGKSQSIPRPSSGMRPAGWGVATLRALTRKRQLRG